MVTEKEREAFKRDEQEKNRKRMRRLYMNETLDLLESAEKAKVKIQREHAKETIQIQQDLAQATKENMKKKGWVVWVQLAISLVTLGAVFLSIYLHRLH